MVMQGLSCPRVMQVNLKNGENCMACSFCFITMSLITFFTKQILQYNFCVTRNKSSTLDVFSDKCV